eukprot:TRINITY_DN19414_c0_g1_i1.p1 TRINITY_DN19414_c0_g1~~TRINITY_DN19414_c0_g1_i1.p1  ORF type:complete len:237 (-),score=45.65 TRINITY_DN19414_c0_g1_i1:137-802(-)
MAALSVHRIDNKAASDAKLNEEKVNEPSARSEFLPPPPWRGVSWVVMFAYLWTFVEALDVSSRSLDFSRLATTTYHLCGIYAAEVILAIGPGCCAMKGWTRGDVLVHHAPYLVVVTAGFATGTWKDWTLALRISLLTSANEGLLVAIALGAPAWIAKMRRIYGFTIVACLLIAEILNYVVFLSQATDTTEILLSQCILPAAWYHGNLMQAYIERWKRTKSI